MAVPFTIPPPVFEDPFVEKDGRLSSEAFNWFLINLLPRLSQSPGVFGGTTPPMELTGQNAALGATALALGDLSTGYYRVTVWYRVTTAAGVSSSVQPFVTFTSKTVACTVTGTALTANAIATPLSHTFFIYVDSPGPISVGANYASNPAGAAVYEISAIAERVQ